MPTTQVYLQKKTLEYRINAQLAENKIFVDQLVKSKLSQHDGYVLLKSVVINPYNEKMAMLYITIEKTS